MKMKQKAVFLDRDGVINEVVYHQEMGILDSPFTAEQLKILPDVGKAINLLHKQGFKVIIISNQPGLAKAHFTLNTFKKMQQKMITELKKQKAFVDAEYYCFHHPHGTVASYTKTCTCRKPKPGMVRSAAKKHNIFIAIMDDWRWDHRYPSRPSCRMQNNSHRPNEMRFV